MDYLLFYYSNVISFRIIYYICIFCVQVESLVQQRDMYRMLATQPPPSPVRITCVSYLLLFVVDIMSLAF